MNTEKIEKIKPLSHFTSKINYISKILKNENICDECRELFKADLKKTILETQHLILNISNEFF